eukprot:354463-Chlamydomonas_euryale.AAC.1
MRHSMHEAQHARDAACTMRSMHETQHAKQLAHVWPMRMEQHGKVWSSMAWRGVAWHGMAWHGMAWHGMAWHGTRQYLWLQCCHQQASRRREWFQHPIAGPAAAYRALQHIALDALRARCRHTAGCEGWGLQGLEFKVACVDSRPDRRQKAGQSSATEAALLQTAAWSKHQAARCLGRKTTTAQLLSNVSVA